LVHLAIDNGRRRDDPTLHIKKFVGGEFHTWTEDESHGSRDVGYRHYGAAGSGQRRSDVVRMKPTDVHDGTIGVVPLKTKWSSGVKLWIPIHPQLADVLAKAGQDDATILRKPSGAPFTSNGFGNFMADKIARAGLPKHCVAHGLRKAAARRLAEAGCTANEIAAITGHATLREVPRYTKAAEQRKAREGGDGAPRGPQHGTRFPNLSEWFGKSHEKSQ
jgi:integrase